MPTTDLNLKSEEVPCNYYIQDNSLTLVDSGELTTSPGTISAVTYTDTDDEFTVHYLSLGFKFNVFVTTATATATLLYLNQASNSHCSVTNTTTLAGYSPSKLSVDKALKIVSFQAGTTNQEIYDYMQYWQSLPANADTLPDGEIYSTQDNVSYTALSPWKFFKEGSQFERYIAITNKPGGRVGEYVPGSNGQFKYEASFATPNEALADPIWGYSRDRDTLGERNYYEIFSDGSPYTLTGYLSVGNSTAANYMVLRAAHGHEHGGDVTAGVLLQYTQQYTDAIRLLNGYPRIENLRILGATRAIRASYVNGGTVRNCIVKAATGINTGTSGCGTKIINCLAYECGVGFNLGDYSSVHLIGSVALNCTSVGVAIGGGSKNPGKVYNNVAIGNATDWTVGGIGKPENVSHNFSGDLTAPAYGTYTSDLDTTHLDAVFINVAEKNIHLDPSSPLIEAGSDDVISYYTTDMDGKPWLTPLSAGCDQLGDVEFVSYVKLVSLYDDVNYYVKDKDSNLIESGTLAYSPYKIDSAILATSVDDLVTAYFLLYGYKYRVAAVPLVSGETSLFLSNDVNEFITQEDRAVVALYTGFSVNKITKEITVDINFNANKIYDYLQYWQSLEAQADLLVDGEIYSTFDGEEFSLLDGWSFIKTGTIGTIYIAISATDITNLSVPGTNDLEKYTAWFENIEDFKASAYWDADLVTLQLKYYVDFHKDNSPYARVNNDGDFVFATVNASYYSAAYHYIVRCAQGDEHKGIWGDGVRLQFNDTWSDATFGGKNFTEIRGLEIEWTVDNSGHQGVQLHNNTLADSCIVKTVNTQAYITIGTDSGFEGVITNCIALGTGQGVAFRVGNANYSSGTALNCVAYNFGVGFQGGTGAGDNVSTIKNCVAVDCTTGFYNVQSSSATYIQWDHNASLDDETALVFPSTNGVTPTTHVGITKASCFKNADGYDFHLEVGSELDKAGVDLDGINDLDIDGQPWRNDDGTVVTQSIGVDQPNGLLFNSLLRLVSLKTDYGYYIEDGTSSEVFSGDFTLSPTVLGPVAGRTLSDAINIYFCKYGYQYQNSGYVLSPDETLLYMEHRVNTNVTLSDAAVAALTGIDVNYTTKKVTVSTTHTLSEVYDYCQYQQSLAANVAYLPDGEILSTVQGNNYTINSAWELVFTAAPTGEWNVTGAVVIGAEFDFSDLNVTGTVYFDAAGTYDITDSAIDVVDTVGGDETVIINPFGSTVIGANNDEDNITINAPSSTLTFTGLQPGSALLIVPAGETSATAWGNKRHYTTSTTTTDTYIATIQENVDISILHPSFDPLYVKDFPVGDSQATYPVLQKEDRAYNSDYGGLAWLDGYELNGSEIRVTASATLQQVYNYTKFIWQLESIQAAILANIEFPFVANGTSSFTLNQRIDWPWMFSAASFDYIKRDGMRYYNIITDEVTDIWSAVWSSGEATGMTAQFQQSVGAAPVDTNATGVVDQLIKVYEKDSFDYRDYLKIKMQEAGYDEAYVDVQEVYGNLADELYVISLEPSGNGVSPSAPPSFNIVIDYHETDQLWNGKNFRITIVDTDPVGYTGAEIHHIVNFVLAHGTDIDGIPVFDWSDMVFEDGDKYKTSRIKILSKGEDLGIKVVTSDGVTPHPGFSKFQSNDGTYYVPEVSSTLTITGIQNLSDVVILAAGTDTVLDDVDQGGTTFAYVYSGTPTVDIGIIKAGYVPLYLYGVALGATSASLPIKQLVDRSYA